VGLDVFLEILRTLKGLSAEVAFVRLERHVNTDVRSNVISLDGSRAAATPLAGEVEIVGALATNMALADVILRFLLVILMFLDLCS
jgi:hypothetical protein